MSSVWQTHAVDGREYYYNTETKQTTWDKPDALKSAAEREESSEALQPTKEFTSIFGKYYYQPQTKETTWTMPDEMKSAETTSGIADVQSSADVPAAALQGHVLPRLQHTRRVATQHSQPAVVEATPAVAAAVETEEKRRFLAMLDVTVASSARIRAWEQAMRLLLRDPSYKLLPTATDRKAAFLEWGEKRRMGEEEARRLEQRQLKVSFLGLLKEHTS